MVKVVKQKEELFVVMSGGNLVTVRTTLDAAQLEFADHGYTSGEIWVVEPGGAPKHVYYRQVDGSYREANLVLPQAA